MSVVPLAMRHVDPNRAECSGTALPEIRCRRLLMKGEIKRVEIKCPKCGCVQVLSGVFRQVTTAKS